MFSFFTCKLSLFKKNQFCCSIKSIIGEYPNNINYYKLAFTQKSSHIVYDNSEISNERLEYLGDAVLGTIVADYLYQLFPKEDEGFLTQMRSKIVKRESLNKLAQDLGFDRFISKSNKSKDIFGNTFEAFVGALYLDKNYTRTKKIVINRIIRPYFDIKELQNFDDNYKSILINYTQKNKIKLEFQTSINKEDLESSSFQTNILINNKNFSKGIGNSKKISEQNAAKKIVENYINKGIKIVNNL